MTVVQNRSPFQVALVVRPPLTGVVALALAHIRAVPIEMQIEDVGKAGCDFAVLDEAAADGGLGGAIAEMNKSNRPVLVLVRNHGLLDRQTRHLRRKLQDDWRRPNVLATMRGQGYMVPITD